VELDEVTSVRKFLFDNDFDAVPGVESASAARAAAKARATAAEVATPVEPAPPPPPPEPTFSEAELKAATDKARAEGQKAGEAKGRNAAMAEIEQRIAATLESMVAQVTTMQAAIAMDREAVLGDAATLALAMFRKMLPEYTRRGGLAEIEAVIERCLQDQRKEPRLVARIAPDLLPALEPRLAALSAATGFEGRLFLIADERLGAADCTIEWADGGLERHADTIWREVSAALDRCLTLQGIPAPADLAALDAARPADQPADTTDTAGNDAGNDDGDFATSDAEAMRSE
jgi:flagellar assembly protein FliH